MSAEEAMSLIMQALDSYFRADANAFDTLHAIARVTGAYQPEETK